MKIKYFHNLSKVINKNGKINTGGLISKINYLWLNNKNLNNSKTKIYSIKI